MISIREATSEDYTKIQQIAHITWPVTFEKILSKTQIEYMLNWMYSIPAIEEQVQKSGHKYIIAYHENEAVGYAAYQTNWQNNITKLHKIYLLPKSKGMGIGKILINEVCNYALKSGNKMVSLNVNRYNSAVEFYKSQGFKITKEEDIEIGKGFLMEDYVMSKDL